MNVFCGSYMNLCTDITHEDDTDIDVSLDIYIIFSESCDYDSDFKIWNYEDKARNAIIRWKQKYYKPGTKNIKTKIRKVLEREFADMEVVKVVVQSF